MIGKGLIWIVVRLRVNHLTLIDVIGNHARSLGRDKGDDLFFVLLCENSPLADIVGMGSLSFFELSYRFHIQSNLVGEHVDVIHILIVNNTRLVLVNLPEYIGTLSSTSLA